METEIEIQECTKNFFDEVEQNDKLKNSFVELFGILEKISLTCETIEELMMSPEIVAFSKAKNIPHEFLECIKNFSYELEQNDEFKNDFFELLEILEKIKPTCETIDEITMSPEIVAFSKAKNIPHEFLEYIRKEALNFSPAPRTFDEAFVMGQRIGRDFFVLKKELEKKLLIRTFEEAFIMGQLICRHFFILKKEST